MTLIGAVCWGGGRITGETVSEGNAFKEIFKEGGWVYLGAAGKRVVDVKKWGEDSLGTRGCIGFVAQS